MLDAIIVCLITIAILAALIIIPQLHLAGNVYRYAQTFNYWARSKHGNSGARILWTPVNPTLIPGLYITDHRRKQMYLDAEGFISVLER